MITYNGSDLILAPIAGFSDVGMRSLCFRYGAGLCYTEMVSAKGLYYKNENTSELLVVGEEEKHTGAQIFGSDPGIMAEVVNYEEMKGFPVVDINCGCPVPKVFKNGDGSALMTDPDKVYAIARAVKNALGKERTLTVKIRKGVEGRNNAVEVALAAEEGGADMVTVHGRTREQMYMGSVDHETIESVKRALKIPVCGNGDVTDGESYRKMKQTGVDYVMIARGAIGRPYVFSEIRGETPEYRVAELIKEHIDFLSFLPEKIVANMMKKQIAAYLKGGPGQKKIKEAVFRAESLDEVRHLIDFTL